MKDEHVLITSEVAELLGVHKTTLLKKIKRGDFPEPNRDRHGYFWWHKDVIDKYILDLDLKKLRGSKSAYDEELDKDSDYVYRQEYANLSNIIS